ncbi:MAG: hypothetical protein QM520_00305 [Gammaproteobacteria bacterium]|nr:hypothetical protein [Gammaproteobacteria bacterium]
MDATLVQSMARPRKEIIIATDGSGGEVFYENGSQPGLEITKRQGADPDAMRLKKGGRVTYGHRVHTVTDGDGYLIGATA